MVKMFDIVDGKVTLNPFELSIPAFKAIYDADKDKNKEYAFKCISYIILMYKWDSPYSSFTDHYERDALLKKEIFNDSNKQLDELTKTAIDRFKQFQNTFTLQFLDANLEGAKKLIEYYKMIDWNEKEDRSGKAVYSSRDLASNIEKAGGIIKSLYALQEQVKREQIEKTTTKGGTEINYFERPR